MSTLSEFSVDTADRRNPAPVEVGSFKGFCTSQVVVWDF